MQYGPTREATLSQGLAGRTPSIRLLLGLGALSGLTLALAISATSETLVASAFDAAFAARIAPESLPTPTTTAAAALNGIAGTEDFWLRANVTNNPRTLVVGQRITLHANGQPRQLQITSVTDAGDAFTHIQTTGQTARVLMITCREGDEKSGRDVSLRLEAGQIVEMPSSQTPSARAL